MRVAPPMKARLVLLLSLFLLACSGPRGPQAPEADTRRVEQFAAQGYGAGPPRRLEAELELPSPISPDHPSLTLLQPQGCGPCPLVVYLPGLGESARAGRRWREAWAQAGYAVLSVQALEEDASAWRSTLARSGEFRQLRDAHFGAAVQARRLALLQRALRALRERALAGVDWSQIALAGYELGAQTALELAAATPEFGWRALILISPSDAVPPTVWRGPVLLLSGEHDGDPLAQLDTGHAAQRNFLFRTLPGPTWQLWLHSLSHAQLSGSPDTERTLRQLPKAPRIDREIEPGPQPVTAQADRGRRAPHHRDDLSSPWPTAAAMTRDALERQALQTLGQAFLDAHLRQSARARDWLAGAAADWASPSGRLRHR